MIKNLIIVLISISFFNCVVKKQKNDIEEGHLVFQDLFNTSMNTNVKCYRIPAIVTAPNGTLKCSYNIGNF